MVGSLHQFLQMGNGGFNLLGRFGQQFFTLHRDGVTILQRFVNAEVHLRELLVAKELLLREKPGAGDELHLESGLVTCQRHIVELRQRTVIALQTTGVDLRRLLHELLILGNLIFLLHLITSKYELSYNKCPKRSAEENYFMVPNEIFSIDLDYREISLYSYLLRCENRETYQCYPSYKTIGNALGMCENTVAKYVRQLEDKGLIYTEPTLIRSKDGKPLNGNLRYTIRPIQGAIEAFYDRQLRQAEENAARYRAKQRLEKSATQSRQNAVCALFQKEASPSPACVSEAEFDPLFEELRGTKEKAG